ncbi:hypothetical protein JYT90_00540 [bacterium AH-315-P07]|nr:hypothetical protein [bacterium AH-315-P07]
MSKKSNNRKPILPLDLEKHAPAFSNIEHKAAQEEGYRDATERWAVSMEIRMDDDYHRRVHEKGKANRRADLESVGVPFEKLGALSDAANNLPDLPEYQEPDIQVPKDDYQRRAAIHGLKNRLVRWVDDCEDDGIVPDEDVCSGIMYLPDDFFRRHVGEDIRERLEAMGEDCNGLLDEIASGDLVYEDVFEDEPESEDPEIQRVLDQHKKDKETFEKNQTWQSDWNDDDDE